MKVLLLVLGTVVSIVSSPLQAMPAGKVGDSMPDAQKIRFCERVRDHALQAFYNRERGQAMKLFQDDGSDGARITNTIIRHIYAEPQISSPKKAEVFGRATCNEMMGSKLAPE